MAHFFEQLVVGSLQWPGRDLVAYTLQHITAQGSAKWHGFHSSCRAVEGIQLGLGYPTNGKEPAEYRSLSDFVTLQRIEINNVRGYCYLRGPKDNANRRILQLMLSEIAGFLGFRTRM